MQTLYLVHKDKSSFDIELNTRYSSVATRWISNDGAKTDATSEWKHDATTLTAAATKGVTAISCTTTNLTRDMIVTLYDANYSEDCIIKDVLASSLLVYDRIKHAYSIGANIANTLLTVNLPSDFSSLNMWGLEIEAAEKMNMYVIPVFYDYIAPVSAVDVQHDSPALYNSISDNISVDRLIKSAYMNLVIPKLQQIFAKGVPVHPSLLRNITLYTVQKMLAQDAYAATSDDKWMTLVDNVQTQINEEYNKLLGLLKVDTNADGVDELPAKTSLGVCRYYRG